MQSGLCIDCYGLKGPYLCLLVAGSPDHGKLIVIFMHNIASGHEKTLKPVGPNNTDLGLWQQFTQQCHLVTDMTFDETRFGWHEVNKVAANLIAESLSRTAAQQLGSGKSQ